MVREAGLSELFSDAFRQSVDEDGAEASFAGQHLTLLGVSSPEEVSEALREVWWSANSDSAITYRLRRVPLFADLSKREAQQIARLFKQRRFGAGETITASSELVCYGLTYWDFRPLMQENGAIGWKLLQSLAKRLRDAAQGE